MAKKLFGKKKSSKKADPAKPVEGQPIITQLSALPADSPLKKRVNKAGGPLQDMATILGIGGALGR